MLRAWFPLPLPFFLFTLVEMVSWPVCRVLLQGDAALLATSSATGSEEGSAASATAFTEVASLTSFCLGGTVSIAGIRGEGSVPGDVSADGWGAHRAGCAEAASVSAGAAGGCLTNAGGTPGRG